MNVLILGASGQCGQWAVRLAAVAGHTVTALVRASTPYDPPASVTVVRGDVLSERDVRAVTAGHDVVLSCLGPQRVKPSNPFSPLKSAPHFSEQSAELIVRAAQAAGIRRLGAISAAGVGDSRPQLPGMMQWLLRHSTIGRMYEDLGRMEQVYAASGLDWFVVRPVTLVNAAPTARTKEVARFRTHSVVGRADVAGYLLAMASDSPPASGRQPLIAWW